MILRPYKKMKDLQAETEELKQENKRLKAILSMPTQLHTVERDVQQVRSSFAVSYMDRAIPEDMIKMEIAREMAKYLKPLIEYDFSDDGNGGKIYYGSLYVANKK